MSDRHHRTDVEPSNATNVIPWDWLQGHAGPAFAAGGAALVASFVVPVALTRVTEWAWTTGLVLAGFAGVAFAAGLLGLYPTGRDAAPRLSGLGAISAAVAGAAGLGLVAMGTLALTGGTVGVALGKPMGIFAAVVLSLGLGLALGLVAFGTALWTTEEADTVTSALLVGGGAALLIPVGGELLRIVGGIATPGWLLFPALAGLSVLGVTVGYTLRRRETGVQR